MKPVSDPKHLTPDQRQEEIVELLVRSLLRLHRRKALQDSAQSKPRLDLVR